MRVKFNLIGLAVSLVLSSNAVLADTADLKSFFTDAGGFANVTSPQEFKGQTMNTYAGGGMSLRVPTRNYQVAAIAPPNLSVGCGGIDIFAGSFSFINADQLVNLFQNIGNNAKGAIFSLAIKQISPQLGGVMDYIQDIAQKMNALNVNSCQAAEGIVNAAFGTESRRQDDKTLKTFGANVSGLLDDFTDGFTKIDKNITKRKEIQDSINTSTDPKNDRYKKIDQNIVWRALSNTTKNGNAIDNMTKRMAMSLFGTVTCKKPATENDNYTCTFIAPNITPNELINGKFEAEGGMKFYGAECTGTNWSSGLSADTCAGDSITTSTSPWSLKLGTAQKEVFNAEQMIEFYLKNIEERISQRGGQMTDISTLSEELRAGFSIVSNSQIPVWMLLKSAGMGGVGHQLIKASQKEIAAEIVYSMITSYARMINLAINNFSAKNTEAPEVLQEIEKLRASVRRTQDLAFEARKAAIGNSFDVLQFAQSANDNLEREKAHVMRELMNRK